MRKRMLIAGPLVMLSLAAGIYRPKPSGSEYDSARLMEEGLAHEVAGDLPGAEKRLLDAARVDHLYAPRWTLAGFYFRHDRASDFWQWSRAALDVGTRDLGALFDLCWQRSNDSETIWQKALPPRKIVWSEYLNFLMGTKRWPAASAAALKIATEAEAGDAPLLLVYCDLAIASGEAAGASPVWNELCTRRILPFAPEGLLVNGDLQSAPTNHGFDWHVPDVPRARHDWEIAGGNGTIRFTLSGYQPEECLLLEQPLVLNKRTQYRFRFEYKTVRLPPDSGVHWEANGVSGPGLSAADWTAGELTIPGATGKVAFVYRRSPGSLMAEGVVFLRKMEILPL